MTTGLFWWRPTRPLRSLATEVRWHAAAWATMLSRGGGMTNFGDELSPLVISEVSGMPVRWAPLPDADLVGVGSVLNGALARPQLPRVFGSGLRGAKDISHTTSPESFVMVRGTLTRDALGLPSDIPLGDPGIIARELFAVRPRALQSGSPLFVPHFAMLRSRAGREVVSRFRRAGWRVALPNERPAAMAAHIAQARVVVTTSLHAIVFAHSYGTPAALLEWNAALVEPAFKYEDYVSALDVPLEKIALADALARTPQDIVTSLEKTTSRVATAVDDVIATVYRQGKSLT